MIKTAGVITVSDKGARGERVDTSGPALCELLKADGWSVEFQAIVPDEKNEIQKVLLKGADELGLALILTTGGTGFSPRDITPEATREITERETPGIPEAMRAESMKITPHGCLSRSYAGIRGKTLIVNLPGSEKAARENYLAVSRALGHGVKMICSEGSAECAEPEEKPEAKAAVSSEISSQNADLSQDAASGERQVPSMDAWLAQAKNDENAPKCGMYLFHNGVVRETAKAQARTGITLAPVKGMTFSYDSKKVEEVIAETRALDGIYYVRVWLNEGDLKLGEDIMLVLIGGDIRPHVSLALDFLVGKIKAECVTEMERF